MSGEREDKSGTAARKPEGARRAAARAARSRAREFAVQALYQHLVGRNPASDIDVFTRDLSGFHKADAAHYDKLLYGCIEEANALDAQIEPVLDRKLSELSPIEHVVMWIGVWELLHAPDVPWRVIINECVELAKSFGGTDGHKYVNGVLGSIAPKLRPAEVAADPRGQRASTAARP